MTVGEPGRGTISGSVTVRAGVNVPATRTRSPGASASIPRLNARDRTSLERLTTSGANDGHAIRTEDGHILWSSGMYGFRDEAAMYDDTFQPYGPIFIMDADGRNKRIITDSLWEDSMPQFVPAKFL